MTTMDAAARREALRLTELFRSLAPAAFDAVLERATTRQVARDQMILRRGDRNAGMVVIVTGMVRICVVSDEGKEVTLAVMGPGEVLGEMSLLDGQPCSADAIAQEDCTLLVLERSQFLRVLRTDFDVCLQMMVVLTHRLRRMNATLEDMASLDLPTRLGRLLARLASDYGVQVQTGTRIGVKLSQKDLGALVGASREKVNKQLRLWEDQGILGKDAGRMVIVNPQGLPSLA